MKMMMIFFAKKINKVFVYDNHELLHKPLGDLTPINYENLQTQMFSWI